MTTFFNLFSKSFLDSFSFFFRVAYVLMSPFRWFNSLTAHFQDAIQIDGGSNIWVRPSAICLGVQCSPPFLDRPQLREDYAPPQLGEALLMFGPNLPPAGSSKTSLARWLWLYVISGHWDQLEALLTCDVMQGYNSVTKTTVCATPPSHPTSYFNRAIILSA